MTLGVRNPASPEAEALCAETGAAAALPDAAVQISDVIILALPWNIAQAAVSALGDLTGKTVIDCMNPLGMVDGALGLSIGHSTSGGEIVAGWLHRRPCREVAQSGGCRNHGVERAPAAQAG